LQIVTEEFVDHCAADFPVGFSTASSRGRIFVAYYNADHDITIACREKEDQPWTHKVLPSRANWDSHRAIILAIDKAGCLHVSGNMHADPLVYFKTTEPLDIETFELVRPMVNADDEARATYPRILRDNNDDLIFMYRLGGSGNGVTIVNHYDADTGAFKRVSDHPLFDGLNEMSAYQSGPVLGPDGRYHLTWVWRNTPHCETNHDLSYAVSDDLTQWRPHSGNAFDPPITPRSNQFVVDPVQPGGGIINGGHTLAFDSSNNPIIAYHKYDGDGVSQVHVARHNGSGWQVHLVSEWDHRWAFSGPGSITSEIQLERPRYEGGQLIIPYWQIKRNHGELRLDAASLERIEDRSVDTPASTPYPAHLTTARSEDMAVRWMRVGSGSDGVAAFRWEVGGKRRFYDAPEPAIPAGKLMYYQFAE
jgi:hypothetical protein